MGHILAIVNQKGGVGKTTTAVNLAACLAQRGLRVLLVDADSQGNATSGLGIERPNLAHCLYDVLVGEVAGEEALQRTPLDGLDLLPATINLAGLEIELAQLTNPPRHFRETRLKEALEPLRSRYDLLFIDSPPSLGLLTINSLTAADGVVIPVQAEYYAMEGVSQLLTAIAGVQRSLNPRLRIVGVVITMYDARTNLSRSVAREVRQFFGDKAFRTLIPRNVRLSEAPSHGLPINLYAAQSAGGEAYAQLAEELMERLHLKPIPPKGEAP